MSFPGLSRRWLIVMAVAAVLAASFAAGLTFGPRELVPALAQQPEPAGPEVETPIPKAEVREHIPGRDPATQPAIELNPLLPIPEGTVTIKRIIQQVGPDRGPPKGPRSADGGPPPGNYVYLPGAHRYVSLPDDVKMIASMSFATCEYTDWTKCPVMPYFVFQRGTAIVGLDSNGVMWDAGEGTDFSAFPFFVFEEEADDQ